MKISANTLNILKWISSDINGAIRIDAGNKIYSTAITKALCTYVEVDEEFPCQFVTADLSKFLAMSALFDEPDFTFNEQCVLISSANGKNTSVFYQTDPACVQQSNRVPRPQKDIAIKFHIKSEDLKKVFRAAAVMDAPELFVSAKDGILRMSCSTKLSTISEYADHGAANTFDIILGECDENDSYEFHYKRKFFKVYADFSYDVEIATSGLAKFSASDSPFKQFDIYVAPIVDDRR